MSEYRYKPVTKIDKENNFISKFNGNTGLYVRTGILKKNEQGKLIDTNTDPFMSSFPELIDIGIMERCVCSTQCNVDCYQKACDRTGNNMSIEQFKWIIEQCKKKVFQVALGGAGDPDTHENFEEILKTCAKANIVPNFTTSGISINKEKAKIIRKYCGAVAVSEHFANYTDNAIKILIKNGIKTNVHYVLNKDTIEGAINILKGEKYRDGINAIVFLLYKPVGLGQIEKVLSTSDKRVVEFFKALDDRKCNFKVGFDSCSCSGLVNYANNYNKNSIDYCEGARFSMYIDANMNAMPCSFANQNSNWHYKLDENNTIKNAWNSKRFNKFRNILKGRCNNCKDKASCSGGCPLISEICLCNRKERTID